MADTPGPVRVAYFCKTPLGRPRGVRPGLTRKEVLLGKAQL